MRNKKKNVADQIRRFSPREPNFLIYKYIKQNKTKKKDERGNGEKQEI